MLNNNKAIIVVCIVLQLSVAMSIKLTRMTQHIDFGPDVERDSVLISDTSNFANPGLVYGACNVNSSSAEFFVCQMFMESSRAVGKPEHVRSCNVTVKRLRPGHTVHRSVVALDDNTAVMIPREYYSSSLTFVHFPDCQTRIVDLDYDLSSARVLAPLDNIFDLIRVQGDAKCFSDCRVMMHFNGSVILNAHKWLRNYQNEYVAMQSPTISRLLVSTPSIFLEPSLQISTVDNNGDTLILKAYPIDYNASIGHQITASTTHQLLSTCVAINLNITCGQFDFTGSVTLQTNLSIVEFANLHSIKVFNLPEGGLLLLYAECFKKNTKIIEYNCQYSQNNLFVTKIDFTGKRVGTIEISQFRGNAVLERIHFFISEENSLCLSQPYVADGFKQNGQLTLDIVCFKSTDFSI